MDGLSDNHFGKESNSLEIDSLAGRVNTHRAMDKKEISKMPKENYQNDQNPLSFPITSFYNLHWVP